jgi:hypothetical protein
LPTAVCSVQIIVASQEDGQRKATTVGPGQGHEQLEAPTWPAAELDPPEGEDVYSFFAPGMGLDDED